MYSLYLINSHYGQALTHEGKLYQEGINELYEPKFNSLEAAEQERDELLRKFVYAAVIIKNLETGKCSKEYTNEKIGPLYYKERESYMKWQNSTLKRTLSPKPKLKYYKPEDY